MAQFAVSAVGAAVGFAIGGPVGAQIGWAAGSVAGALLFAPSQEGPHVSDLKLPEYQYGSKLYRLHGSNRVAGTIGWFSEKRELSSTTSAKGGPEVTTHSAEIDILYIVGIDSDVTGIARVWRNGELIWSQHADSDSATLANSATTDAWTAIRFLDGNASQLPDPTIEAADGVGNVSAYRHRQCVMIEGLQLGQSGQLPLMEFEVVKSSDTAVVGGVIGSSEGLGNTPALPDVDIQVGDGLILTIAHRDIANSPVFASGWSTDSVFDTSDSSGSLALCVFCRVADGTATDADMEFTVGGSGLGDSMWSVIVLRGIDDDRFPDGFIGAGTDYNTAEQIGDGINPGSISKANAGNQFVLAAALLVADEGGAELSTVPSGYTQTCLQSSTVFTTFHAELGTAYKIVNSLTEDPGAFSDGNGSYTSGGSAAATLAITFRAASGITPDTVDLADVVSAEWSRADTVDNIDVTELVGIPVRGFKTTGAIRPGLEQLAQVFNFGSVCSDKVYFRLLGGSSVATIPFADLAANEDQATDTPFDPVRTNDGEIPQKFLLTFPSYSDDYNNGTEEGDRGTGEGQATGEVAVVMTATEGKKVAQIRAAIAGIEATTAQISITDYYARVEPMDPLTIVDEDGTQYRMRDVRETYGGGVKQIDLVRDDLHVLEAPGTTSTDYTASLSVPTPEDTQIVLLDTAILRDADNDSGAYAFAKGSRRGAALYASPTDVTYTQVATFTDQATFGDCTTTLGDWTGGRKFDERNSVTVDVGSGTLSSSTRTALIQDRSVNACAIGVDGRWEIIQFRTATLQSAGVYKLTGLLRGAAGTEWASTGHTSGEQFVLLTSAGRRFDVDNASLGLPFYYKGVTVGRLITSASPVTFTDNGIGQKPYAPTKVRIARDASGNVTFTWGRRSRLSTRFGGPLGSYAPLGETSESYTVRIYSDNTYATVVRSISATSETASYSDSAQVADFGSTQSTLYFDVVQNGALTGYATQKAA